MNSMRKFRILIVCPDPEGLSLITSMLRTLGHHIDEASTDRLAVRLFERSTVNLVLASVDPADPDALELLAYVRRKHPEVPVVLMFPRVHPERAREALRMGAMAVLKYPVPAAELRAAVLQALEQCESHPEEPPSPAPLGLAGGTTPARPAGVTAGFAPPPAADHGLANGITTPTASSLPPGDAMHATTATGASFPGSMAVPPRFHPPSRVGGLARELDLISADPGMRQVVELAGTLAATQATVLISGEPGSGKSLLAHLLHLGGGAHDRPFVTIDAMELSGAGLEGREGGEGPALAEGVRTLWAARLAQARGGTLFVKEVGALSPELQLQLSRDLQLHDIEAASGHSRLPGIRFVLSTTENLAALVEQGKFRPELYHRISTICLMVPPLRVRGADIDLLAEHFCAAFAAELRRDVQGLTRDALEALQRHDWPGNVRELKGVIQRAMARCSGPRLTCSHLASILNMQRQSRAGSSSSMNGHVTAGIRPLKEALEEPEKRIIIQALQAFNWNRQETARVLDINRTTLYKKMKKYGLLIDEPIWVN
jgi:two-component system response regulator HydG